MCFSEGSIGTLIIFWRKRLLYQLSHSHFHVFLILQYQESSILILLRWNEFKSRQSQQIFLFNWSERAANGRGQIYAFIFLKGTSSASFQTNIITFFTTIICKKCPYSIRRWDSNSPPLQHESPPITTWPGIMPLTRIVG